MLIKLEDIHKDYMLGKVKIQALRGVSLQINTGEMLCFMGSSGCGKSTLLKINGGIDGADCGKVWYKDQELNRLNDKRLSRWRNQHLGFIFQNFNLVPVLSAYENVEQPLLLGKFSRNERKERVLAMLELVGMSEHIQHRPDQLSGGQRQRVAIARALVTQPEMVLADEPTASLDSTTGQQDLELMQKINETLSTTFVFSTHDYQVTEYAKRIVSLSDGLIEGVA